MQSPWPVTPQELYARKLQREKTVWTIMGVLIGLFILCSVCVTVTIVALFGGSIWLMIESLNAMMGL